MTDLNDRATLAEVKGLWHPQVFKKKLQSPFFQHQMCYLCHTSSFPAAQGGEKIKNKVLSYYQETAATWTLSQHKPQTQLRHVCKVVSRFDWVPLVLIERFSRSGSFSALHQSLRLHTSHRDTGTVTPTGLRIHHRRTIRRDKQSCDSSDTGREQVETVATAVTCGILCSHHTASRKTAAQHWLYFST